jgi:hypothetical protein
MQKVVNLGEVIKIGVNSKTHYLVEGIQNESLVDENGLSTKEEKAYDLLTKVYPVFPPKRTLEGCNLILFCTNLDIYRVVTGTKSISI